MCLERAGDEYRLKVRRFFLKHLAGTELDDRSEMKSDVA
jgi:hypothetical protein